MKDSNVYYDVGPLLYTPAYNKSITTKLSEEQFGKHFSLAFCLEDTVNDDFVEEAEKILKDNIKKIFELKKLQNFYLPKIFIRVRNPKQIIRITKDIKDYISIIEGFVIPKFNLQNCKDYIHATLKANEIAKKKLYIQPTLESDFLINLKNRIDNLYSLRNKLKKIEELVLNIRVGGNDLCNLYGYRRSQNDTIYKLLPIAEIFTDIITVFGQNYVISGPVWEYYSGEDWEHYLKKEIHEDKLCGFIGKTVIHPSQIEIVNKSYKISKQDYDDAVAILNWDKSKIEYVSGNSESHRMNEYKTHYMWAKKIMYLSETYGIAD